jgi:hypothetical protein
LKQRPFNVVQQGIGSQVFWMRGKVGTPEAGSSIGVANQVRQRAVALVCRGLEGGR